MRNRYEAIDDIVNSELRAWADGLLEDAKKGALINATPRDVEVCVSLWGESDDEWLKVSVSKAFKNWIEAEDDPEYLRNAARVMTRLAAKAESAAKKIEKKS